MSEAHERDRTPDEAIPEESEDQMDERDDLDEDEDGEDGKRRYRHGRQRQRPKTIPRKEMVRELRRRRRAGDVLEIVDYDRPCSRSDCANGPRPCLYVSCRYHLYLDVNPRTGSIKINFPDLDPWELEESCALDVADRGSHTLEEVGEILNLTRERIRQLEIEGMKKVGSLFPDVEVDDIIQD